MLTNQRIKEFARKSGADLVGIASIDRFEGAPQDMHPATTFPETKSVIMLGARILRGSFRGIEEGTEWSSYWIFGYGDGIYGILSHVASEVRRFIESYGWEAMEIPGLATLKEYGPMRQPVAPDRLPPNLVPSFRFAAVAAGLGEIGHSKVFLTPEFGSRQRFNMILTDAPLEPDPLFEGEICDHCLRCVSECPARAISKENKVTVTIAGKKLEWGNLDVGKCKLTHWGFNRRTSPFLIKDMPGFHLDVEKQKMSWREAYDFGMTLSKRVRYIALVSEGIRNVQVGRPGSICGARGCIQACFDHLESTGRIPKFRNHFRKRKRWILK